MSNEKAKQLVKEYKPKKELFGKFAVAVRDIMSQLAYNKGIKIQSAACREKDTQSLFEKIVRKAKQEKAYTSLNDIDDLAGVRLIFYLENNRKQFIKIIHEEFGDDAVLRVEEKNKSNGYRATHVILKLDQARLGLTEYSQFKDLKCELQITSVLYHVWSEVEHDIIYKPKGDAKLLHKLGLDELERSFEKIMQEYITSAALQFDYIDRKYRRISRAGEILASDFVDDINQANSNDSIYEILDILKNFYHKKPDEVYAVALTVLSRKPIDSKVVTKIGEKDIYGKTSHDIGIKAISLLKNIRYFKPDEVLFLSSRLIKNSDEKIAEEAKDVVRQISTYNYNFINQAKSYWPQRKVLDFILAWSNEERLDNFDFIEVATQELLKSSFEGSEWVKEDTLTHRTGSIGPTDFIKKLRTETIDLLLKLYRQSQNEDIKLRVIKVLGNTTSTSHSGAPDEVLKMVTDDFEYLISQYEELLFDEAGKLIAPLSVVEKIETRLYWLLRNHRFKSPNAINLRQKVLSNKFYHLFRLLAGDPVSYQDSEGWDTSLAKREEEINQIIKDASEGDIEQWDKELNTIAKQYGLTDEWQFQTFREFLFNLTMQKPELANQLLINALEAEKPLKVFTENILSGLRSGGKYDLWDNQLQRILKIKDKEIAQATINSLFVQNTESLQEAVRESDLELIEKAIRREQELSFLSGYNDWSFNVNLFRVLTNVYLRDPERVSNLMLLQLKSNLDSRLLNSYLSQLGFAVVTRNWMPIEKMTEDLINKFSEFLVKVNNFDWHVQDLMLKFSKNNLSFIMNIILKRIKHDAARKQKEDFDENERYEAVPFHFHDRLRSFIAGHSQYPELATGWVLGMTQDWSIYNWHVSNFIERIGGPSFNGIIEAVIDKGGDDNLEKASRAIESIDGVNVDLCMKIIGETDSEKIISRVEASLFTTGVVSGEYGIAEAFEGKAKQLGTYLESDNPRIKSFVQKMIINLNESAQKERQRSDEEREIRKIEFED